MPVTLAQLVEAARTADNAGFLALCENAGWEITDLSLDGLMSLARVCYRADPNSSRETKLEALLRILLNTGHHAIRRAIAALITTPDELIYFGELTPRSREVWMTGRTLAFDILDYNPSLVTQFTALQISRLIEIEPEMLYVNFNTTMPTLPLSSEQRAAAQRRTQPTPRQTATIFDSDDEDTHIFSTPSRLPAYRQRQIATAPAQPKPVDVSAQSAPAKEVQDKGLAGVTFASPSTLL